MYIPFPDDYQLWLRLKNDVVIPAIWRQPIGSYVYYNTDRVVSDDEYRKWGEPVLSQINRGPLFWLLGSWRTEYFRFYRSLLSSRFMALRMVRRFYRLFTNIKENGLDVQVGQEYGVPYVFHSREFFHRIDGFHRVAVARFLGHKEVPALMISPRDILALPELPVDISNFLKGLEEPDPREFRAFATEDLPEIDFPLGPRELLYSKRTSSAEVQRN